jgi:hypothetical protein
MVITPETVTVPVESMYNVVVSMITVNYEVGGKLDGTIYGIEVGTAVKVRVDCVQALFGTEETANATVDDGCHNGTGDHETVVGWTVTGDHDLAETVTRKVVGTEATTVDGTKVTKAAVTTIVLVPIQANPVDGKVEAYEAGTTTGDDQLSGTVMVVGTKTNCVEATLTTMVDGTVTTALDETQSGTAVHGATTVDDPTHVYCVDEITPVKETGIITGDVQAVGTTTVVGMVTSGGNENDEAGTVTTMVDGTVAITLNETVLGTLVNSTTALFEFKTMTYVDGRAKTEVTGTTTGEFHVFGTKTVEVGIEMNELKATYTIAVLGTVAITLYGTEFGTLLYEIKTLF